MLLCIGVAYYSLRSVYVYKVKVSSPISFSTRSISRQLELKSNSSENSRILAPDQSELQLKLNRLLTCVATTQIARPMPLINRDGKTWTQGSFCEKFLLNTFHRQIPICSEAKDNPLILCYGNEQDPTRQGTCSLKNVAIQPRLLYDSIDSKFKQKDTIFLVKDEDASHTCPDPATELFAKNVREDEYQVRLLKEIKASEQKPSSICDAWINKTAFFFTSRKVHIYFRFLAYYNVHKTLWDHQATAGDYVLIRLTPSEGMLFPEFDDALFPGTITLHDLPDATVCFRKVVTVPNYYSCPLFRCKMNTDIRDKCLKCNGKQLSGTPFHTFHERTLKSL